MAQTTTIIPQNSQWQYLVTTSAPAITWRTDISGWSTANTPLGFGPPPGGQIAPPPPNNVGVIGNITTYFRKTITLADTMGVFAAYKLSVRRDDGVVVYVNGQEVFRDNLRSPYGYDSVAIESQTSDNGTIWHETYLDGHILKKGNNVIAVEVHQSSSGSQDLYFNLELIAYDFLQFSQTDIIKDNDSWKYLDKNTRPASWEKTSYNDATWVSGNAELGFGDGDETTIIDGGPVNGRFITTYFRKTFTLANISEFYRLRIKRDDAIVVYFNGVEVFRDNILGAISGAVTHSTLANNAPNGVSDDGEDWLEIFLKGSTLQVGSNTIAVEIHQADSNSSDISFNLNLIGINTAASYINRGPYLMLGASTSMQIRWQTNTASDSKVMIGNSPTNLTTPFVVATVSTDHLVNLSGLTPNTKYYYSVGSTSVALQNTSDNFFITPPTVGTVKKTRVLAMGDMGKGNQFQRLVMDKFLGYVQDNYIDLYLPLGDLAYKELWEGANAGPNGGTMNNFQKHFFQMSQNDRNMKQTPIYPVIGNHEFYNYSNNCIDFTNFNRPYFTLFNMPTSGQEGGVPSGTERYYSFNKANIHFIVLDAFGKEGIPGPDTCTFPESSPNHAYLWEANNVQKNWLKQDLAANTQKWTVVSLHAPPYTKGSHNSDAVHPDKDWYLAKFRDTLVRIFEKYNVDLVLSGHSHSYERSKLIKGHYGMSNTYNSALYPTGNEVSQSSGKYNNSSNSCPYFKSSAQTNGGVVYVVAGSGGELESSIGGWPHPAMTVANNQTLRGAFYLEIDGNQLDAKWIAEDGSVQDQFTIMKDVNVTKDLVVQENAPTTLTASYSNGGFVWTNGSTVSSIIVTPPATGITTYSVHDTYGCVTDVFNVRVIPIACQSSFNVNYDINANTTLKYETGNTIIANKIINSGANVKFDAGKSITLSPGFKTVSGAIFKAYIDGCGNLNLEKKETLILK